MHGYYSMCIYYFINFTFAPFFSLLSVHNELSDFHLLIFFFLRCTQTHPHTNKPTQTTNREIDRCLTRMIDA